MRVRVVVRVKKHSKKKNNSGKQRNQNELKGKT